MNDTNDSPINFASIDPTADPAEFDRRVEALIARAATELAARRVRSNPILQLALWRRPMLAAAAVVAVVSATILTQVQVPQAIAPIETDGIAEAVGIPQQMAQWIWNDSLPSTADLYVAFQQ